MPETSCLPRLSPAAVSDLMTRRSVFLRACDPGSRSANHMDANVAQVAADGHHGLSCPLGSGRLPRHAALNDLVFRSLVRAGYPSTKEPTGLLRTDGRRPDGHTLIPGRGGKNLVWHATATDTLAASYLPDTSLTAGMAAERASTRKTEKYSELSSTHLFTR